MSRYRETAAATIAQVVAAADPLAPINDLVKALRAARPKKIIQSNAEFRIWMSEENKALKEYKKLRAAAQDQFRSSLFTKETKDQ